MASTPSGAGGSLLEEAEAALTRSFDDPEWGVEDDVVQVVVQEEMEVGVAAGENHAQLTERMYAAIHRVAGAKSAAAASSFIGADDDTLFQSDGACTSPPATPTC